MSHLQDLERLAREFIDHDTIFEKYRPLIENSLKNAAAAGAKEAQPIADALIDELSDNGSAVLINLIQLCKTGKVCSLFVAFEDLLNKALKKASAQETESQLDELIDDERREFVERKSSMH